MKDIRFGIIGYGNQGRTYAAILLGKPLPGVGQVEKPKNCKLTSVSDLYGAASDIDQSSDIATYTDWKEMINSKSCDAVILTVPHFLHPEITVYALEHGVHVLCEKPAAVRASDVENMIAAAERHPELTFGMMLNQRTNNIFHTLKEMIDSGELGQIRRSNWIINSWWRPDSYYQSSAWRGTWSGEGGGLLVNQAPHQLDLWTWLCGKPTKVYAICKEGAYRDIDVENDVTLVTEYENGATGSFISCTHDPVGTDRLEIDLSKGKIVVDNSNKATVYHFAKDEADWNDTMEFRMFTGALRRDPQSIYKTQEITGTMKFGSDYVAIFSNFADHVINGTPLIAPGADGLTAVQLANTAQLSSSLDKPLAFPCDSTDYNEYLKRRMREEKSEVSPVPIKNIGHASFNVRNMDEMLHFYCDLIGMKRLFSNTYRDLYNSMKKNYGNEPSKEQAYRLEKIASMGEIPWVEYLKLADRQYLELFHDFGPGKKEIGDRRDYYGYMKLNYEVADIEEIKTRLVEGGVTIDSDIHPTVDGSLEIAVHDPDGNEVQFTQYCAQALNRLGAQALSDSKIDTISLARYTTQMAYRVRAGAKMKKFYCEGLGLKKVLTLTYSDLLKSMEQSELAKKNPSMIQGMKALGNLPWIDYLEVAPHQYIELFYEYGREKKEERNLMPYYGYQHICLEVSDIKEAWDAVIANGLTPDTPISLGADKSWQFWLVDPDGNRLELMEYADVAKQLL